MTDLTKQEERTTVPNVKSLTLDSSSKQRRIFEVDEGHRSKQTAIKYRNNFDHFLNFVRIRDLDVFLDLGKEAIQELVINYVLSMRDDAEKMYSRSTINTNVAAILYFLENNDIELNKRILRRYYPSDESTNDDRSYTTQEIAKILPDCDLREKAMILLMASSGVRIGATGYKTFYKVVDVSSTNPNIRTFKANRKSSRLINKELENSNWVLRIRHVGSGMDTVYQPIPVANQQ